MGIVFCGTIVKNGADSRETLTGLMPVFHVNQTAVQVAARQRCVAITKIGDWYRPLLPFVILGLDPRIHAGTAQPHSGAEPLALRHHPATRPPLTGFVYMTASYKRATIYIVVTNSLGRRTPEHKEGTGSRFTARYGVKRLVWYEEHFDIRDAIQRKKTLKHWPRQLEDELIEQTNPEWNELFRDTGW